MTQYWNEFLAIVVIHLLAVASPGPDFAVIIRQSVRYGRQTGVITAMGLGCGIALHVTYSLVGIGALMRTTPWILEGAKILGAVYLVYLGIQCLRSKPPANAASPAADPAAGLAGAVDGGQPARKAFWTGFMTNATNPKATLFFLALFSTVVSATTPVAVQAVYGAWMVLATAAWFALLATALSQARVRQTLVAKGYWLDRCMGVVLLVFAARLFV